MNIIYTWAIISMEMAPSLDGLSDVVTLVRFKYTGTDSISGYLEMNQPISDNVAAEGNKDPRLFFSLSNRF